MAYAPVLLSSLALTLMVACGPQPGETLTEGDPGSTTEATNGGTSTTDTSTTDAPTTGEPPPEVDCEALPLVLDAPAWDVEFPELIPAIAVGPAGDPILLQYQAVMRVGASGPVWTHTIMDGESVDAIATWPDGQVLIGGSTDDGLLLARLGVDGSRLATRTHDLAPDQSEWADAVAIGPTGDVFVAVRMSSPRDQPQLRVDRYDPELAHVWSAELGDGGFQPGFGVDADGQAYVALMEPLALDQFESTWSLEVRAVTPDGQPGWSSTPVELVSFNVLPDVDLSVGDQVYALLHNRGDFILQAFAYTGELAWEKIEDLQASGDHFVQAVAASPCGGAYLGGRSDVEIDGISERAGLLHVAPDGTFGPVAHILDTPHDGTFEYDQVTELAVSPLGEFVAAGDLRLAGGIDGEAPRWVRRY